MGNHRADRRGTSRRPSDLPTPVEHSAGGKRRAEKPRRRSDATPVPTLAALHATERQAVQHDEQTLVLPVTPAVPEVLAERPVVYSTSRVGGVRAESTRRTAPSAPGARRSSSRAPLFRGLPSAPAVLGLAALAISAGGAVTAANLSGDETPRFTQASALSGASSVGTVNLLDRRTVSRDSRRDALSDKSNAKLLNQAEAQNRARNATLAKFAQQAEQQAAKLRLNQWQLPLTSYHLTARFGESSGLWSHLHTGLDFAAPSGTPIHAVANGVVTSTGYDGAYGNKTVITLDDGTELWYCHQTSYVVSVGQEVHAGDVIGSVGSTGNVTGPHLHLEVRPGGGDPVDPYTALVVHGLQP